MTTLDVSELHERGVDFVREGQVVDRDGRPLRLRAVIQRRWGWPRAAADMAAERLRATTPSGEPVTLWLTNPRRAAQQRALLGSKDGEWDGATLEAVLMSGLARGSSREVYAAGRRLRGISLRFNGEIEDMGLSTEVLEALAQRLGVNLEILRRDLVHFSSRDGVVSMDVDVSEFGPETDR